MGIDFIILIITRIILYDFFTFTFKAIFVLFSPLNDPVRKEGTLLCFVRHAFTFTEEHRELRYLLGIAELRPLALLPKALSRHACHLLKAQ